MAKNRKFFIDAFPPPNYLKMPAVCFDISDRSIKYIELETRKGASRIKRFGLRALPEGVIQKGEIKQKDKLAGVLKTIKKNIGTMFAVASLPEEKGFLSRLNFPKIEKEKIREALKLQFDEHIPISVQEAVFDFEIIGESKNESHFDLNLAAFPRKIVEDYRDVIVGAGFVPLAFEMETQAFTRAIVPDGNEGYSMVIDFGRTRATFAIVGDGKVQFTTTAVVPGEEIEKILKKYLNLDESGAEKVKREKGFLKSKIGEEIYSAILPLISAIKNETRRHIDYWSSHYADWKEKNGNVTKIFLCGGESTLAGLPEYLSYELKTKTELGNPWVNVASFEEYVPEIEMADSMAYSTVIGLALGRLPRRIK